MCAPGCGGGGCCCAALQCVHLLNPCTLFTLLKCQNSLGGNSLCSMLATISPSTINCEESLTTLRYVEAGWCVCVWGGGGCGVGSASDDMRALKRPLNVRAPRCYYLVVCGALWLIVLVVTLRTPACSPCSNDRTGTPTAPRPSR
jgi:hypothetical protein